MVGEREAAQRLIAACPRFMDSYQTYLDEGGAADEYYNVMGELAEWVVERITAQDIECLAGLFNEVEALLGDAGDEAKDLVILGFLEEVQNFCVLYPAPGHKVDPDIPLVHLGLKSRQAWFELIARYWPKGASRWPGQLQEQ